MGGTLSSGLVAAGLVAMCARAAFVPLGGNPIPAENAHAGTSAWQIELAPPHAVEGYASEVSLLPGQTLHLHVSSRGHLRYRVEVYRIGWYGGTGGRLMPCLACRTRVGVRQPTPAPDPQTGVLRLSWPVTDVVPIGAGWASGYYMANLVVQAGKLVGRGSWIPFIVREPATRCAAISVQASVNTWQAYNRWGGRSLYWNHTGVGDNHVSFDRPYDMRGYPPIGGPQANQPFGEFPLVRFLERYGYDVAYTTDVDTDGNPNELLCHRVVMTSGHDEYWTKTMRDAFEAARDAGVNLAFVSGDSGYWQMRYEDNRRTIVEYRTADNDPESGPGPKDDHVPRTRPTGVPADGRDVRRGRLRRLHRCRRCGYAH